LTIIKRKTKKITWLVSILGLILLIFTSCTTSSSTTGTGTSAAKSKFSAAVEPASRNVKAGDTFTFDVVINTEIPSRGAQCTLAFDPAIAECTGLTEGYFYKNWAADNGCSTTILPDPLAIDNTNGRVASTGVAVWGAAPGGVTGKGILFTYHFTAVANGTLSPVLSDVHLSDESGNDVENK
jgi:hypothetical protein